MSTDKPTLDALLDELLDTPGTGLVGTDRGKSKVRAQIVEAIQNALNVKVINHAACSIDGKSHGESCRRQTRLLEAQAKRLNEFLGSALLGEDDHES